MTRLFFWVFIMLSIAATILYALGVKNSNWELPAMSLGMALVAHIAIRFGH